MEKLPPELLLNILQCFTEIELERVALVNRAFYKAVLTILSDRYRYCYDVCPPATMTIRALSDDLRSPDQIMDFVRFEVRKWFRNGKLHRVGAPACISFFLDGRIEEVWFRNGHKHRDDGPARVSYPAFSLDDRPTNETWFCEGQLHRDDGPAIIEYYRDGFTQQRWYRNGKEIICPTVVSASK